MSTRDPRYGDSTGSGADPFGSNEPGNSEKAQDKAKDAANTAKDKGQEAKQKGQQAMDDMSQKGQNAKAKTGDAAHKAQEGADQGMDQAASGLNQASDMLRSKGGEQGGSVGSAAAATADKMDTASGYLREKDTDQIVTDLEALVRRKPTESLLVAAGIGFVLSKVFK
jgi:ElaB/YqjD/DUF883 family membrane-anchored ribosome-binding protein